VTPTKRKTYVFESRLNGSTIRVNIGTVADWPIEQARTRAQALQLLIGAGRGRTNTQAGRFAVAQKCLLLSSRAG